MTDQDDASSRRRRRSPAESNVAISSRIATAATMTPIASAAPDASPSRRSSSRIGSQAEVLEDDPVARLGRAMAGDEPRAEPWLERDGDERRGRR